MSRPRILRWVAGVIVLAVAGTGWLVSRAMPDPGIPWTEVGRGELLPDRPATGPQRRAVRGQHLVEIRHARMVHVTDHDVGAQAGGHASRLGPGFGS